jgi:hypothetical protein
LQQQAQVSPAPAGASVSALAAAPTPQGNLPQAVSSSQPQQRTLPPPAQYNGQQAQFQQPLQPVSYPQQPRVNGGPYSSYNGIPVQNGFNAPGSQFPPPSMAQQQFPGAPQPQFRQPPNIYSGPQQFGGAQAGYRGAQFQGTPPSMQSMNGAYGAQARGPATANGAR